MFLRFTPSKYFYLSVDSSHACVQTIFGVLDHLKVWLRKKFSSGDDRKPKDQRQTSTHKQLMGQICLDNFRL